MRVTTLLFLITGLLVCAQVSAQPAPTRPATIAEVLYQACKQNQKCRTDAACVTRQLMQRVSIEQIKQAYKMDGEKGLEKLNLDILLAHPEIVDGCTSPSA